MMKNRERKPVQIGDRFGRLIVLEVFHRRGREGDLRLWCRTQCDCGAAVDVLKKSLQSGNTSSCGCLKREKTVESNRSRATHGWGRTRLHGIWCSMRRRCQNQDDLSYPNYGGRGIHVCWEWGANFEAFRDWALAHGYTDDLTIERKDVDAGYCPDNCCWIPMEEQCLNKRQTVNVTAFGETRRLLEWLEDDRCTVQYGAVYTRLAKGWSPEAAINIPSQAHEDRACCPKGHPYTEENTLRRPSEGHRRCAICQRERDRQRGTRRRTINGVRTRAVT